MSKPHDQEHRADRNQPNAAMHQASRRAGIFPDVVPLVVCEGKLKTDEASMQGDQVKSISMCVQCHDMSFRALSSPRGVAAGRVTPCTCFDEMLMCLNAFVGEPVQHV